MSPAEPPDPIPSGPGAPCCPPFAQKRFVTQAVRGASSVGCKHLHSCSQAHPGSARHPSVAGVVENLDERRQLEEATGGPVVICRLDAPDTELAQRIHAADVLVRWAFA
ncbi:hypothetical protein EV648_10124 [Kribbella sp. VKM Ac-2568]|nr:hypothetical protein EV648_10124 [Kribbella sp. VKM Ac-2568]